jgi:hypothetical protein
MILTMELKLQNPHRLPLKEQARRFRRIHKIAWTRFRRVLDGQEDQTYLVRELATELVDEILDPMIRQIMNPEVTWDADIIRNGYTIRVIPREGRLNPFEEE